jgi:hypothetical protein
LNPEKDSKNVCVVVGRGGRDNLMMPQERANSRPRRETSEETIPADDALTLDVQPLDLQKISVCCWSHPVCGTLLWQPQKNNTAPKLFLHSTSRDTC